MRYFAIDKNNKLVFDFESAEQADEWWVNLKHKENFTILCTPDGYKTITVYRKS